MLNDKGQALFGLVLIFLIVALFFILTLHFLLVREISTAEAMIRNAQSKALAFSGLRLALEAINVGNLTTVPTTTVLLTPGVVSYAISTTSATTLTIPIQTSVETVEEFYRAEVDRPNNRISRIKLLVE